MEEKKHKIFTRADIEKYHKGLLSAKEMHELEKAALEDAFLADALEGYSSVSINAAADLAELQRKLEQRVSGSSVVAMPPSKKLSRWWRVAAAAVILGGVGFLTFKLSTNERHKSIAEINEKKKQEPPVTVIIDSNKMTVPDSGGSIAKNSNATAKVREPNPAKKTGVRILTKKIDSTGASPGLATTPQSVASNDKNYSEQKKESASERETHDAHLAAPVAAEKMESRAARAEGVLNEQQGKRVQPHNFTGRVVDVGKNAIPFANITNTRDNVGTYANAMGYFTLISPDSVLNVRVRSVGFENGEMQLKNNVDNQVVLLDDKTAADKILDLRNVGVSQSRAPSIQVEEPEPVDGWTNYNRYMVNNINMPEDLKSRHENGQVQLSFDVNDNGEPVNVKVDKSLCKKCDEEAIRLVIQGPKWRQKDMKGKRAKVTVPFHTK